MSSRHWVSVWRSISPIFGYRASDNRHRLGPASMIRQRPKAEKYPQIHRWRFARAQGIPSQPVKPLSYSLCQACILSRRPVLISQSDPYLILRPIGSSL
jgi:hypothetical protein